MKNKEIFFGAILREKRESYKISLRKLAEEAELDPAYLSRIERGKIKRPGREIIETIAAALCRKKELQEADCEELNRYLLLGAKYKLSDADLLGLKPGQSITTEELFAQRLREKEVPEQYVLEAKKNVPLHRMSKVLSGEEPLHILEKGQTSSVHLNPANKEIEEIEKVGGKLTQINVYSNYSSFKETNQNQSLDSSSDHNPLKTNVNFNPGSSQGHLRKNKKVKERKFKAGARAFIQVNGDLTSTQEGQLRALTTLVRSILKRNK